jgi:uncharacterized protein (UPF0218 family)
LPIAYVLTAELRIKLKEPIGKLIRGSFTETAEELKNLIAQENPQTIIAVGDTVSENLAKSRLFPKLWVIDNKVMRKAIQPIPFMAKTTMHIRNPPGTITEEAVSAIREGLENRESVQIVVDGEEDLLTLIAIVYAPENALVVYGQPNEGIVVVKVTPEKRKEVVGILDDMRNVRKAK